MLAILGLFLAIPIVMALWVSFTDWNGRGSPFSSDVELVGAQNYAALLTEQGLSRQDFMISLRNTFYYVVGVVPLQTVLALVLAVIVNQRFLRGRTFFRTAFYFPSVVSSVAISLIFLFLFTGTGAVNQFLALFGIEGPVWFSDPRGLIHLVGDALGLWSLENPPSGMAETQVLSLSIWEWFSGPSVALTAIMAQVIWTTAGTFMLMFLAGLQDLPAEVEEAAMVDGANRWQRFRNVTVPHLRPTILLVITLGVIGTWQVFDQMYIMTQGGPAKTTLTPAFLSYTAAFRQQQWGEGAAMAFLLFLLIFVLTSLQRFVLRDKDEAVRRRDERRQRRAARRRATA
jgi:multiple sugar transport system permease protein